MNKRKFEWGTDIMLVAGSEITFSLIHGRFKEK